MAEFYKWYLSNYAREEFFRIMFVVPITTDLGSYFGIELTWDKPGVKMYFPYFPYPRKWSKYIKQAKASNLNVFKKIMPKVKKEFIRTIIREG